MTVPPRGGFGFRAAELTALPPNQFLMAYFISRTSGSPGMKPSIHIAELRRAGVRVYLRRADIAMAEQLLNHPGVDAAFAQPGREGMAESMSVDMRNAGLDAALPDHLGKRLPRHRLTQPRQKDRAGTALEKAM